jgi:hypothetical protein
MVISLFRLDYFVEQEPVDEPKKIYESEKSVLWYQRDVTFKIPKVYTWVRIYTNEYFITIKDKKVWDMEG